METENLLDSSPSAEKSKTRCRNQMTERETDWYVQQIKTKVGLSNSGLVQTVGTQWTEDKFASGGGSSSNLPSLLLAELEPAATAAEVAEFFWWEGNGVVSSWEGRR